MIKENNSFVCEWERGYQESHHHSFYYRNCHLKKNYQLRTYDNYSIIPEYVGFNGMKSIEYFP